METTNYYALAKKESKSCMYLICTLIVVAGLIMISIGIRQLANYRHQKNSYTDTSKCYVNLYFVQTIGCGKGVTCYNEQFKVTYQIFNQSRITSWIDSKGELEKSLYNKNGTFNTCLYKRTNVTAVIWKFSGTAEAQMFIPIGIVVVLVPIIMIICIFIQERLNVRRNTAN